jgi:hypothetical protein
MELLHLSGLEMRDVAMLLRLIDVIFHFESDVVRK